MKRMFAMFSGSKFVRETRRKNLVGDDADLNVWFKFHSKYSPRIVGVRVVAGKFSIQSTFPKNKVPHKKIEQRVCNSLWTLMMLTLYKCKLESAYTNIYSI